MNRMRAIAISVMILAVLLWTPIWCFCSKDAESACSAHAQTRPADCCGEIEGGYASKTGKPSGHRCQCPHHMMSYIAGADTVAISPAAVDSWSTHFFASPIAWADSHPQPLHRNRSQSCFSSPPLLRLATLLDQSCLWLI